MGLRVSSLLQPPRALIVSAVLVGVLVPVPAAVAAGTAPAAAPAAAPDPAPVSQWRPDAAPVPGVRAPAAAVSGGAVAAAGVDVAPAPRSAPSRPAAATPARPATRRVGAPQKPRPPEPRPRAAAQPRRARVPSSPRDATHPFRLEALSPFAPLVTERVAPAVRAADGVPVQVPLALALFVLISGAFLAFASRTVLR